jgi:hypothetical protein
VADQSIDHISFHDCIVRAVARRGSHIVLYRRFWRLAFSC